MLLPYRTEFIVCYISCRCFLAFKINFSKANVFGPYIRRLLENTAVLSCHYRAKIIWIRHNSGTTMMSLWGKMVYEFRVLFIFFLVQEVQARHCWRQTKSFNTCKRCWRRKFVRSPCFTSFLAWQVDRLRVLNYTPLPLRWDANLWTISSSNLVVYTLFVLILITDLSEN